MQSLRRVGMVAALVAAGVAGSFFSGHSSAGAAAPVVLKVNLAATSVEPGQFGTSPAAASLTLPAGAYLVTWSVDVKSARGDQGGVGLSVLDTWAREFHSQTLARQRGDLGSHGDALLSGAATVILPVRVTIRLDYLDRTSEPVTFAGSGTNWLDVVTLS